MFHYAIFDMDGTIADSMYAWQNVTLQFMERHGIPWSEELDSAVRKKTMEEGAEYFYQHYDLNMTVEEIIGEIDGIVYQEYKNNIQLKPGVLKTLQRLKELQIPAALVTASDQHHIDALLSRLNITDLFAFTLSCSDFGKGKDFPDIYLYAAERLGGTVPDTAVFEDAYHAVVTASSAGFPVYAVAEPVMEKRKEQIKALAHRYLNTMDEVLDELPDPSAVAVSG